MIDQHAAQAGINARNMPGPYGQFVTEYNQRIATENAVTAQAKRQILEDMVVDRLELVEGDGTSILSGGDTLAGADFPGNPEDSTIGDAPADPAVV